MRVWGRGKKGSGTVLLSTNKSVPVSALIRHFPTRLEEEGERGLNLVKRVFITNVKGTFLGMSVSPSLKRHQRGAEPAILAVCQLMVI